MANPKVAMKAELEEKYRRKYEEKLKEAEKELLLKLAQAEARFLIQIGMAMQQACDAALMAADDIFEVTEENAVDFVAAHIEYVNKMSHMAAVEDKDDPEMWWTKDTVDKKIRSIVGEKNFVPWDERYSRKEK